MKLQWWYTFTYKFFWPIFNVWLPRKFAYECELAKIPHKPYIIVANHSTFWDAMLVGMSFKEQMFFVASDNVMRAGLSGKALKFIMNPIIRVKSQNEVRTIISIFERLKQSNVCIFSEGTVTPDGETKKVMSSTGKLIKKSGAALVTYRVSGGYLTYPRWCRFHRKGKLTGKVINVYSAEQLQTMTAEEVDEAINKDIYVHAFKDQEKEMIPYRGEKLAEYLETILSCCPQCKNFSTLASEDDRFFCKCGFEVRYTEYGFFELPQGKEGQPTFRTVWEWWQWQEGIIRETASRARDLDANTPIFTDHNQDLYLVTRSKKGDLQGSGTLHLYNNRLSLTAASGETITFPLETVLDIAVFGNRVLMFSTREKKSFEIKSVQPTCAIKYKDMVKLLLSAKGT